MNDTLKGQSSGYGHLTQDEIVQLEIQAANERRRVLAQMEAAARAEGIEQGATLAQRALLLRQAALLAPDRHSELASIESVQELEREVMALIERR